MDTQPELFGPLPVTTAPPRPRAKKLLWLFCRQCTTWAWGPLVRPWKCLACTRQAQQKED
jgi:hypothetical protein